MKVLNFFFLALAPKNFTKFLFWEGEKNSKIFRLDDFFFVLTSKISMKNGSFSHFFLFVEVPLSPLDPSLIGCATFVLSVPLFSSFVLLSPFKFEFLVGDYLRKFLKYVIEKNTKLKFTLVILMLMQ